MTAALDVPHFSDRALCAETDPDAFFPEKGGSAREAKRICNGHGDRPPCPVRQECRDYALERDERFGVYGGLSERERRRLRAAPAATSRTSVDLETAPPGHRDPQLGPLRRAEVQRLTALGWSARKIADHLHITRRSVVRHRSAA